jgi:hypothetical protein
MININGKKIAPEKIVKFLGLYFETDLIWNLQVEAIRQKYIKSMAVTSYIQTTWMGAHPIILLELYIALSSHTSSMEVICFTPSLKVRWIC